MLGHCLPARILDTNSSKLRENFIRSLQFELELTAQLMHPEQLFRKPVFLQPVDSIEDKFCSDIQVRKKPVGHRRRGVAQLQGIL